MSRDPDDTLRILHERARRLARVPAAEAPSATLEVLEFRLSDERYAIEAQFVDAVHPLRDLTPLPGTPPFIRGIVNLRGRIVPVLDLRVFFDLPAKGLTDLHRVIQVRSDDIELGLLADMGVGLRSLAATALQPSLTTLTDVRADYLKGVADGHTVVLDLRRIMADPALLGEEGAA